MKDAWVGIDVAIAKRKRLPIVVCTWEDGRLVPLPLRRSSFVPPAGMGNAAACDPGVVARYVDDVADHLRRIEAAYGIRIARIGIDAPSAPRAQTLKIRAAEAALHVTGISCFITPSAEDFEKIRARVRAHLKAGGAVSRLPHANQLWMLVGFELFRRLSALAECVEVYPQATVRRIGIGKVHKSKAGAVAAQLAAAARHTGWPNGSADDPTFADIAWAPGHDRLDAYLSGWVAALDEPDRIAYGTPPDDVIWVPRVTTASSASAVSA